MAKTVTHKLAMRTNRTINPRTSRRAVTNTDAAERAQHLADKKSRQKRDGQSSTADHLSTYFRDLGGFELLDPDQEKLLAQQLEAAEIGTWNQLLSYPSAVDYVLSRLEARMDNSLPGFERLREAAEATKKNRRKADRDVLAGISTEVAQELLALDYDRQHAAAMVAELERLASGTVNNVPFSVTSATFKRYRAASVAAHEHAWNLRNQFVRSNLRLVVTMARRYDRGVMPLSDLIQEGNLGLMHAVSRFDHRRGLRFSTYACWWIRHAIGRALADKSRAVRIPVHMIEAQQQLNKARLKLVREFNRQPTEAELAEASGFPTEKLQQMQCYLLGAPVSMDGPVRSEEGRTLNDVLPDPKTEDWTPADRLTEQAMTSRVTRLMAKLSPIEADVLRQRFGIIDDEEHTFREIGDQYNLSRERIRQIQNSALSKLRRALQTVEA